MSLRRHAVAALQVTLAWVTLASMALASEYTIDAGRSVFAVLTHKAGIASGMAHDHLVVAGAPSVNLKFDPERPEATKFTFVVATERLEIDAPAARAAWKERFRELGIHSGELPPVSDSDRGKVRVAMLGPKQLDSAKFPEIRAEVLGIERRAASATAPAAASPATADSSAVPGWDVVLRLTIHGRTLERRLPATWSETGGTLAAEIVGELPFRDFGIEPYSTMLGAIRNDDRFHLFVSVVARRAP